MNILIAGCGNIGFETAKLLSKEHKLLLIDLFKPPYINDLIIDNNGILFVQADATDITQMEKAIKTFTDQHQSIDALISTIGAIIPGSPMENFQVFKKNFELNFFGNLVPIKCVIDGMIAARSGRIIVMSSTTGHHSPKSLAAYAPAKWAIECLCSTLRSELRPFGVTVDVLSPASIKNRYSRTFMSHFEILEAGDVASRIQDIIRKPKNSNHFIPTRYRMLHIMERMAPSLLDRKSGLNWRIAREKKFKKTKVNNVLIIGASSDVGIRLAYLNAKTAKKLYLIGNDYETLQWMKNAIEAISKCDISISALDLSSIPSIQEYTGGIKEIDLLINIPEQSVTGSVNDTPVDHYKQHLDSNFFGMLYLMAELFKKDGKPKKIINVLSSMAIAGRRDHSPYACANAAFWAITKSLRRMYGNELQVIEVISSPGSSYLQVLKIDDMTIDAPPNDSTVKAMAQKIHSTERNGKEIVIIPSKAKLLLVIEALMPGLYNKVYT